MEELENHEAIMKEAQASFQWSRMFALHLIVAPLLGIASIFGLRAAVESKTIVTVAALFVVAAVGWVCWSCFRKKPRTPRWDAYADALTDLLVALHLKVDDIIQRPELCPTRISVLARLGMLRMAVGNRAEPADAEAYYNEHYVPLYEAARKFKGLVGREMESCRDIRHLYRSKRSYDKAHT